jgi:hypothetical protein
MEGGEYMHTVMEVIRVFFGLSKESMHPVRKLL